MLNHKDCSEIINKLINSKLSYGKSLIELTTYNFTIFLWSIDFNFYNFIKESVPPNLHHKMCCNKFFVELYKYIVFFLDITINILIRFIMIFQGKKEIKKNIGSKVPKILFTAQDIEWREIRDYETNHIIKSDAFFHSIIKKLLISNYELLGTYPISRKINSLKIYIDKMKNWHVLHKPFDLYWNLNVWSEEKKASKYFKKIGDTLKNNSDFNNLSVYNNNTLDNTIRRQLIGYFYCSFPKFAKQIEIAKQIIDKEKPDLILIENEYGFFQRALIVAAKQKKVPTLAIQHGVITPTHPGYIFNKENKDKIILPDITCVYGQYHYDLLTEDSIYEPEQVIVTGQPRYDVLYNIDTTYSKKRFLEKYGINPNHKIILWTTQSHGLSEEENTRNLAAMFKAMQKLKNTTLIIKQHPGERKKDTKKIRQYLTDYKINALMMDKKSDTYEQIFICDLMIAEHSTTIMEAVALNKPAIVLDLNNGIDYAGYVTEGVARGVYKKEDITIAIEELLKDDSYLAKKRDRYIEKYLYKIDGKASERVVNIIENMISSNELQFNNAR